MSTLTGPHLLRFLLSLVVRLRLSVARAALALRAQFVSLWRSILAFARRRSRLQIQPCSNNVPAIVDSNIAGQHPQSSASEGAKVQEEYIRTLAVPPVQPTTSWEDKLSRYTVSTPSPRFKLHPATPEGSQRYYPGAGITGENGQKPSLKIQAGQLEFLSTSPQSLPEGWTRLVHPEGNVLFYHAGLRVFTENDVISDSACILHCAMQLIQKANKKGGVIMDELTEVVLNLDGENCQYYFVDHTHRLLFWVHELEAVEFFRINLRAVGGYSHIRYMIESQYWVHCQYYPHNRTLPKGAFRDLRGMLNYAKTDVMTADSSTSPFAQDELVAILDIVNSLKDDKEISDPYSIWIIGRLMVLFTEVQFLNFCGQPSARLNADSPLFGRQTWHRTIWFRILNIFLFGSPHEHAVRLQRVWVDGIIIQPRWKDFVNRLIDEFSWYTIFSTVLLTVNFGFLAPGLVNTATPTASPIQIMIYCSEVSTVGSIVFSLALLKVYKKPELLIANRAAETLRTLNESKSGMARLAITHSLPIACLIWSMALFSMALAVQIFSRHEPGTYAALGAECVILVAFGWMGQVVMGMFTKDDDAEIPVEADEDDDAEDGASVEEDDASTEEDASAESDAHVAGACNAVGLGIV